MVTWAVMVYSGKADVTHLAGCILFTSLISIHFFLFVLTQLAMISFGTIQPVGHEIHKSFDSLIEEKCNTDSSK